MQQDNRKRRLQQVKELIREKGPISDRELKALVDVEHGIREETTTSYLRSLQNAGFIMECSRENLEYCGCGAQKMKPFDYTSYVLDAVKDCPNCAGELKQISSFRIQCQTCGYNIRVQTKSGYWAFWASYFCLIAFVVGIAIGLIL